MEPLLLSMPTLITLGAIVTVSLLCIAIYGFRRTYQRHLSQGSTKLNATFWGIGGSIVYFLLSQILLALIIVPVRIYLFDYAIVESQKFSAIPDGSLILINKYSGSSDLRQLQYVLLQEGEDIRVSIIVGLPGTRYSRTADGSRVCEDQDMDCESIKEGEILVADEYPLSAGTSLRLLSTSSMYGVVVSR